MLSYIIQFWEAGLIALVVILELLARWFDRNKKASITFEFDKMPVLRPVRIPTTGRGVLSALWVWISKSREWEVAEDFYFSINGVKYVIPTGFTCNCVSIPRFLRRILSPTGILLIGALVHDYGYRYQSLMLANKQHEKKRSQKHFDRLFRDINIQVNGFKTLNYIPYYGLRMFGFFAWNKRKRELNG